MTRTRLAAEPLADRLTPTTLPAGFAEALVAGGLASPTALAQTPDGRLLVTEQAGTLEVIHADGTVTPALRLAVDSAGERGLLGVAVDPGFAANGFVYLYHTVPAAGATPAFNRVSRFTLRGDAVDPASEAVLADLDPLSAATNHNGGAVQFGPDGRLYVAVGENANPANAQSLATRLGKILRYNPDGTIPADNPTAFDGLAGTTSGANRAVWAVGFRNPFTFGFEPGTGRMFVNDVGQGSFEEIDDGRAGRNYGWPATEGDFDPARFPNFTRPVFSYPHGAGDEKGFAIAGAAFYRPAAPTFPADYIGDYFFADFVNNWVRRLDPATGVVTPFASGLTAGAPVDLDVTPGGDLLVLERGSGAAGGGVYRIGYPVSPPPAVPSAGGPEAPSPAIAVGRGDVALFLDPATGAELARFDVSAVGRDVRVATADVTGDGRPDLIAGAGPGGPPTVAVFDGVTRQLVARTEAFEGGFGGGVFVAGGYIDTDGRAEVVVTPDEGGGPRVRVLKLAGTAFTPLADFMGIGDPDFRGGARAAVGDIDQDGATDLAVSAGVGGGPRVAVYDGRSVAAGAAAPRKLFADFFAFEDTLRNGAYVAIGDVFRTDVTDLVFGAGPGGGPRVTVIDGDALLRGRVAARGTFFAGDPDARGGVRVAATNADRDGRADVFAGTAPGTPGRLYVYRGLDFVHPQTLAPFGDDPGGVFVG